MRKRPIRRLTKQLEFRVKTPEESELIKHCKECAERAKSLPAWQRNLLGKLR